MRRNETPCEAPEGAASGATLRRSELKIIILSLCHQSGAHLWFTFFHEIAHLLLHTDRVRIDMATPDWA
ncbi:ImmA/IrrE family metallo-endopeptidase [Nonomuraea sp. NPDC050663]|uniref:ImmA/IrrE family metallo-endopeptidase n=1 Tax=Nonomuraea sp. NPDC050663 TaxID=3364370 RepID=UPI0037B48FD1